MKISVRALIIWGLFLSLLSCTKDKYNLEKVETGINSARHPDVFMRLLQTRGKYSYDPMPTGGDSSFNLIPINYDTVVDFQRGSEISISFSLQNLPAFFVLDSIMMSVVGAEGHWKVPFTRNANRFVFEFFIPNTVSEFPFCLEFSALVKAGQLKVLTQRGKVCFIKPPTLSCATDTVYGKLSDPVLTIRKVKLGNRKGKVIFRWSTGGNPDRFDVKYMNNYVLSSSTRGLLPAGQVPSCRLIPDGFVTTGFNRSLFYEWDGYDPALSDEITLYLTKGCGDGSTLWDFSINCPN